MRLIELWGWCSECARWFYIGHGDEKDVVATDCPVCARPPVEVERRLQDQTQQAQQTVDSD